MNSDQAYNIMSDFQDYYGRKLPKTALKYWVHSLRSFHPRAAEQAMKDCWDSGGHTMPNRNAFISACVRRQQQVMPPAAPESEFIDDWETALGAEAITHFNRFLDKKTTLEQWANDFRAIAVRQGVADKICWERWTELCGVQFYVE